MAQAEICAVLYDDGHFQNKFSVLLIDDDPFMHMAVARALLKLTDDHFELSSVQRCRDACALLKEREFDIVLLDNFLSTNVTARKTVPKIRAAREDANVAIVSSDTSPDYLNKPSALGVEFIIDKIVLVAFLRERVMDWKNGVLAAV